MDDRFGQAPSTGEVHRAFRLVNPVGSKPNPVSSEPTDANDLAVDAQLARVEALDAALTRALGRAEMAEVEYAQSLSARQAALQAEIVELRGQLAKAFAEQAATLRRMEALSANRDVALAVARRTASIASAAEAHLRTQVAELRGRAETAERAWAAWQARQNARRARLNRILMRSGTLRAVRAIARMLRRVAGVRGRGSRET